jgi:hypothetical protein
VLLRDGVRAAAGLSADLAVLPEAAIHPFGEPDGSLAAFPLAVPVLPVLVRRRAHFSVWRQFEGRE